MGVQCAPKPPLATDGFWPNTPAQADMAISATHPAGAAKTGPPAATRLNASMQAASAWLRGSYCTTFELTPLNERSEPFGLVFADVTTTRCRLSCHSTATTAPLSMSYRATVSRADGQATPFCPRSESSTVSSMPLFTARAPDERLEYTRASMTPSGDTTVIWSARSSGTVGVAHHHRPPPMVVTSKSRDIRAAFGIWKLNLSPGTHERPSRRTARYRSVASGRF